ncbi:protein-tyrosine phosphatase [Pedobacter psychrotolerans]|uniref:Protein tyrosine phosphatase n=1 Tax=Pedobacter psychrotolerans TaxID=1843235 RepID=A0A4R2HFJ3_9SPHI|nr:protein tyrosine phosphatase [Pedobacter psychrotolerans]TCO27170.1 protein-tyrosine phosphatase [Pedobacter psychrotolerans]GGE59441.1 protein-tyrosine-phosphatase [Pedobacter psychrotolerans]
MNILFICSRNKWRSLTAETIFKNNPDHQVKSAGTEPSARIKINAKMIIWADLIFVMEKRHRQRISERFPAEVDGKEIITLGIPDDYQYMDEDLIEELNTKVSEYL